MTYYIVGLGNPGDEYKESRHNVGRDIVDFFRKKNGFSEWKLNNKAKALTSEGKIGKNDVDLILPDAYMNKSGVSLRGFITSVKAAHSAVVVYDDLDLPIGKMKISFNRSSGGHRGVLSIEKNLKTREFIRLRVGVTPATASGKLKKPHGEKEVVDFILGKFKKSESEELKKVYKRASEALEDVVKDGLEKAMGKWNSN
ncbi:MAG: aminoacyl-tRNA hydrolase [Patescibacteria group bacterium]|mgnify:CR=1 FL=1